MWLFLAPALVFFFLLAMSANRRRVQLDLTANKHRRHRLCDPEQVEYTGAVERGVYSLRCTGCSQSFWTDLPPPPGVMAEKQEQARREAEAELEVPAEQDGDERERSVDS